MDNARNFSSFLSFILANLELLEPSGSLPLAKLDWCTKELSRATGQHGGLVMLATSEGTGDDGMSCATFTQTFAIWWCSQPSVVQGG